VLSKHRLGKSSEPITKNMWTTGEFEDEEDTDEDERNRSKSIQVLMHVPDPDIVVPETQSRKEGGKGEYGAQGLSNKEKKSIRRELNDFAKKLRRVMTRKTTVQKNNEEAKQEPLDLHGLIENQEGLEAKLCEGSAAQTILKDHKNKNKKKQAPQPS